MVVQTQLRPGLVWTGDTTALKTYLTLRTRRGTLAYVGGRSPLNPAPMFGQRSRALASLSGHFLCVETASVTVRTDLQRRRWTGGGATNKTAQLRRSTGAETQPVIGLRLGMGCVCRGR